MHEGLSVLLAPFRKLNLYHVRCDCLKRLYKGIETDLGWIVFVSYDEQALLKGVAKISKLQGISE